MATGWLDSSLPHNGFIIGANIPDEGGKWFHSEEYIANPSLRPKLTLEYYYADVQPTILGKVKVLFNQKFGILLSPSVNYSCSNHSSSLDITRIFN